MKLIDVGPYKDYLSELKHMRDNLNCLAEDAVNRTADRHLARCKKNTAVGQSPDSPTLRLRWDRSGVHFMSDGVFAEVFNPAEHAAYYEFGHRQTPGRLVFVELRPGESKYGRAAVQVKNGKHAGKWGLYIRLKKSYVKGAFVMTDSEEKAQHELDAAARCIDKQIGRSLG